MNLINEYRMVVKMLFRKRSRIIIPIQLLNFHDLNRGSRLMLTLLQVLNVFDAVLKSCYLRQANRKLSRTSKGD